MEDTTVKKPWPYKVRIKRMAVLFIVFAFIWVALAVLFAFVLEDPYKGRSGNIMLISFTISIVTLVISGIAGIRVIRSEDVFLRHYKPYRLFLSVCAGVNLFGFFAWLSAGIGSSSWGTNRSFMIPLAALIAFWAMIYIVHKEKARLDQESEALLVASEGSEEVTSCEL